MKIEMPAHHEEQGDFARRWPAGCAGINIARPSSRGVGVNKVLAIVVKEALDPDIMSNSIR